MTSPQDRTQPPGDISRNRFCSAIATTPVTATTTLYSQNAGRRGWKKRA
jgi:hypothetical protein